MLEIKQKTDNESKECTMMYHQVRLYVHSKT